MQLYALRTPKMWLTYHWAEKEVMGLWQKRPCQFELKGSEMDIVKEGCQTLWIAQVQIKGCLPVKMPHYLRIFKKKRNDDPKAIQRSAKLPVHPQAQGEGWFCRFQRLGPL